MRVYLKVLLASVALLLLPGRPAVAAAECGRVWLLWNDLKLPDNGPALLVAPGAEQTIRLRGRDRDQGLEVTECGSPFCSCHFSGAVLGFRAPRKPGSYELELAVAPAREGGRPPVGPPAPVVERRITLHLLVGRPNTELVNGVIDGFELGIYPVNEKLPWNTQVPAFFWRLDYGMLGRPISERFKLGDLGYDGRAGLPQYFTLDYALVKKLEVLADELEARGRPSRYHFIGGGFISPKSNGVRASRNGAAASQSRHMWGEAVDFIIDDDRNEILDDMNRDGTIDVRDAFYLRDLVTELEEKGKVKPGGFGVYSPPRNEALTMHIDVRGYVTRWGYKEYDPKVFAGVPPKKGLRPGSKR